MDFLESASNEVKTWFFKIFLPTIAGIAAGLAVHSKKERVTWKSVIVMFVCGIVATYLVGDYVIATFSPKAQHFIIAIVAISGEKIGTYIVYDLPIKDLLKFILFRKK